MFHIDGIVIGLCAFLVIGVFHPVVIKSEYYFGSKIWPIFLIVGIICCALSVIIQNIYVRIIVGIIGFSSLWAIGELKEQKERVEKGWFPKNPKRKE
jgi:uncharacterized membrane protein YuzA (DUF378 family)